MLSQLQQKFFPKKPICLSLNLHGKTVKISHVPAVRAHVWVEEGHIRVYSPVDEFDSFIKKWLKKQAYQIFSQYIQEDADRLGVSVASVRIKDLYSRWGSCSVKGNINLSWRLIFAPPEVARYVCSHEVAHLKEMNHSLAFWRHVATLCPLYKTYRHWLKTKGYTLYHILPPS